jgi:hypothetical protein
MLSAIGNAASYNWFDSPFPPRPGARGAPDDALPREMRKTGQENIPGSNTQLPQTAQTTQTPEAAQEPGKSAEGNEKSKENPTGKDATGKTELSESEQRELAKLKETDRAVRQHEAQHIAAGGSLVKGGASFSYQKGPDGRSYATGGEVSIDTSKGRTPEETLSRAIRIRAAALAPADPSPQDRSVAAMASQMEMQAMREIAQAKMEENRSEGAELPGQVMLGVRANGVQAASAYQAASAFGQQASSSRFSAFA